MGKSRPSCLECPGPALWKKTLQCVDPWALETDGCQDTLTTHKPGIKGIGNGLLEFDAAQWLYIRVILIHVYIFYRVQYTSLKDLILSRVLALSSGASPWHWCGSVSVS